MARFTDACHFPDAVYIRRDLSGGKHLSYRSVGRDLSGGKHLRNPSVDMTSLASVFGSLRVSSLH